MKHANKNWLPRYRGLKWVKADLPTSVRPWTEGKGQSLRQRRARHRDNCERLGKLIDQHGWRWPTRPVCFITDIHADTDALIDSLVASGGFRKTGPKDADFRLAKAAKKTRYIIGGDCFDKGPGNLRLLRMLRRLIKHGMNLRLLAGNHDIRVMLGMRSVGEYRTASNEHFFVRLGPKAIPLMLELREQYLDKKSLKHVPSNRRCRELLYPSAQWQKQFPLIAKDVLSKANVNREIERLNKKMERLDHLCEVHELSMQQVYAATLQWQKLFLEPGGEFHWFFDRLHLLYRQGSFLFIHAGLDDHVAELIHRKGFKHPNRRFRRQLKGDDLEFYYGPLANSIRTKYRAADYPLSHKGVRLAHESGVHAIIHGHRNLYHGQRISLRRDMINFECDTTMDRGSRSKEGLKGAGAGVTLLRPREKVVLGISSDYKHAKVFDPSSPCTQESKQ